VFDGQQSGYTRLYRTGPRQGDNAEIARLEWVKPLIEVVSATVAKSDKIVNQKEKKVTSKKTKTQ
jgi:hypothetical protein